MISLRLYHTLKFSISLLPFLVLLSCSEQTDTKKVVVLYTSLDRPHSEPVIRQFEEQTGITVQTVYDTEAAKTVGLTNRLIAEKRNPTADVFWNSEVIRTIRLQEKNILEPYQSAEAKSIPSHMKDPDHHWTGFAARCRCFFFHKDLPSPPRELNDMLDPRWKGKFAIANPLFGTTNTHLGVQWQKWGAEKTRAFYKKLKQNGAIIVPGNAMARDMVLSGEIDFCLTDTDDAWSSILQDKPFKVSYPDQDKQSEGTLFIPNTVALIRNGPNPDTARELIDYLLSTEVESQLAHSQSSQIPLRKEVDTPRHVSEMKTLKIISADFPRASQTLDDAGQFIQTNFLEP